MRAEPTLLAIRSWHADLGDVTGEGMFEAEALEAIRALEELKAAAAAGQARLTAHLYAERSRRETAEGVPARKRCAGLGAEVALARRVSPHQGNRHLGMALALTREMPHTLAALTAGRLSEWRATLVVRETAVLTSEHRAEVDRELGSYLSDPDRSGWGDRRLSDQARRIGYRLDPGSALRRVRGAQADRRVSVRPAPDTMTYLTGFMPVAQGVACHAALAREADRLKATGDVRTRGQIMADTLVARLTGQAQATGTPVEINVVMTDRALLSGSPEPAHVTGYGTIPAETARGFIRDAEHAWVRRLYAHPDSGALVTMDSRRRHFTGQLRHLLVLTSDTCATPWCDAPVRHADHTSPVRAGGDTTYSNGSGLCEACNYTKDLPGWDARLITRSDGTRILHLYDPTRHQHQSRAPDPPGAPDPATRFLSTIGAA